MGLACSIVLVERCHCHLGVGSALAMIWGGSVHVPRRAVAFARSVVLVPVAEISVSANTLRIPRLSGRRSARPCGSSLATATSRSSRGVEGPGRSGSIPAGSPSATRFPRRTGPDPRPSWRCSAALPAVHTVGVHFGHFGRCSGEQVRLQPLPCACELSDYLQRFSQLKVRIDSCCCTGSDLRLALERGEIAGSAEPCRSMFAAAGDLLASADSGGSHDFAGSLRTR